MSDTRSNAQQAVFDVQSQAAQNVHDTQRDAERAVQHAQSQAQSRVASVEGQASQLIRDITNEHRVELSRVQDIAHHAHHQAQVQLQEAGTRIHQVLATIESQHRALEKQRIWTQWDVCTSCGSPEWSTHAEAFYLQLPHHILRTLQWRGRWKRVVECNWLTSSGRFHRLKPSRLHRQVWFRYQRHHLRQCQHLQVCRASRLSNAKQVGTASIQDAGSRSVSFLSSR